MTVGQKQRKNASQSGVPSERFGFSPRLIVTALWIASLLSFVLLWAIGLRTSLANYLSSFYLIVPLMGGFFGLRNLRRLSKRDRRAALVLSLGLILWAIGCLVWIYYNLVLKLEIPYPSWADGAYFASLICFSISVGRLYQQFRGGHILQDLTALGFILATVWGCTGTAMYFAHGATLSRFSPAKELFKFLLDLSYPAIDAVNVTVFLALLLGGRSGALKKAKRALWFIFGGYVGLLLSDLSFNVASSFPNTSALAYYNGCLTDAMFVTTFYLMSLGLSWMPSQREF